MPSAIAGSVPVMKTHDRLVRLSVFVVAWVATLADPTLAPATAREGPDRGQIAAYLDPYVKSNNFSGSILVLESGKVLFRESYGHAAPGVLNGSRTKYHVASLSMQFTAAAIMRLVEQGKLSLDTNVASLVAGIPNGEKITLRELLQQDSGLPDANDLPGYDDLLKAHQTPESLVGFIRGKAPRHQPGGRPRDEEHSAYNLLALIAEKVTRMPFKEVVRREVFAPLGMNDSGIDDDGPIGAFVAQGHVEDGLTGLKDAPQIHWSAKTGNGSAYSTIEDERRWLAGFLGNALLSTASRQTMLDWGGGYGWERYEDSRFKQPIYFMGGEGPGFRTSVIYLPRLHAEVVALSNCKIGAANTIAFDLAAMLDGGEYRPLRLRGSPLTADEISQVVGSFRFGPDFYRPNAILQLAASSEGLTLRWPGGPDSPVLVIDGHHFIDRHYWTRFSVEDQDDQRAAQLVFGKFTGQRTPDSAPAQ
jgi:D-alanyl-D-alanine carboxypeptidase